MAIPFRRPSDSRYLKSNTLRHAGADRESRRIPAFYCSAAKSASLKPRCLFRSARNGTSGTRWNKHRRFCTFWQNLGLPFGSAVGLCPTVPLPIDGSEAACRRQDLSLLTELRAFPTAFDLQTCRSYGAESPFRTTYPTIIEKRKSDKSEASAFASFASSFLCELCVFIFCLNAKTAKESQRTQRRGQNRLHQRAGGSVRTGSGSDLVPPDSCIRGYPARISKI